MLAQVNVKETYSLYEVLGTRYLTPHITQDIKEFLESCKKVFIESGKQVTVDLKHCKFNPDNYRQITDMCDFVQFIDSDNPIIDSMLDHNSRVSKVKSLEKKGIIKIESIPVTFDISTMLNYVKNLDRSKVYRLCSFGELNGRIPDVSILIAMCIGYLYPDVSVDLSEQAKNYFRIFRKFWSHTGIIKRDSYNLLWYGNILKTDVVRIDEGGDNLFYIPGVGEISEDVLNSNFEVIPYDFGNKKPDELDKDEELKNIYMSITGELQKLLKKKKVKKLTSELTTIERD